MPLETGSYISDLDANNPSPTDVASQGDDHIRLIKSVLKNTFPNLNGAVSATDEDMSSVASGAIEVSSVNFGKAATPDSGSGFSSTAVGKVAATGRWAGNGFVPVGALVDFPKVPSGLGTDWLECDGSILNISAFPDLGAFLGSTFGGDGTTTFGLPNLKDTGRFRRSRTATLAAGTYQANVFKTHNHTGSTTSTGTHNHAVDINDPQHHHATADPSYGPLLVGEGIGGAIENASGPTSPNADLKNLITGPASTGITASIAISGGHSHGISTDANSDGGSTETRPEAFVVVTCIKT
jgi:microcystin-dependent protein